MNNVPYFGPLTGLVNSLLPPLDAAKVLAAKRHGLAARAALADAANMAFFSHITYKFEILCTRRDVVTAAVNKRNQLFLNPEWLIGYTKEEAAHVRANWPSEFAHLAHARDQQLSYQGVPKLELAATLAHEAMHPAFLYWERMDNRKALARGKDGSVVSIWNMAHDYMINLMLGECSGTTAMHPEKWSPPGLYDKRFINKSSEEIYEILLEEISKNTPPPDSGGGQGVAGDFGQELAGKGDAEDSGKESGDDSSDGSGSTPWGEHVTNEQYWKVAVLEAAQKHEKQNGRGSLPLMLQKIVDDIRDPRVDWPIVLSRWVGENGPRADFSYSRPSRRSDSVGSVLPGLRKHGCADVCVLWDSSGSMNGLEEEIMSEIIGICEDLSMTLRVIVIDSAIFSDQSDVESPSDVLFGGGGGSNFCPAFERLDEEGFGGVVVAFTDGMIGTPYQPPPHLMGTLWVLMGGYTRPPADWGAVLCVDQDGKTRGTR